MRANYVMVLLAVACSCACEAGGPLQFTPSGAVVWDHMSAVKYTMDRGKLGAISEPAIQDLVKRAFKVWSDVPTAAIKFEFTGLLSSDVATFADYLAATSNETGGNVVIFDDDGDIVAEGFGEDNRNRILGFAAPVVSGSKITAFYSLMNGRLAGGADTFLSTLVHEFGHAIGLDHSQINAGFVGDGNVFNDKYIPTMFPTSSDDDVQLGTLNPDDIAWVSLLYPSGDFNSKYGTLTGRIVRGGGGGAPVPALGVNVIAIRQGGGETSRMECFSCVSDWLAAGDAKFKIPLPPGKYRLHIEPIRFDFTGGSSVGPHSASSTDLSFVNSVNPSDTETVWTVTAGASIDAGDVVAD